MLLRYTQFFWIGIFISLDIYPRVWLLDYMLTLFLIFLRNLHTVLHQFTFPPTMQTFLHPQQYLLLVVFLVIVIVTDVMLHLVVLICISLIISGDEHLFMCFLVICIFFRKVSILVYCPFFIWGACFFLILSCILDINPLSDVSLANICFHSVGYLFVLLMISLTVKNLLSLIRSHFFIIAFVSHAWGDRYKEYCWHVKEYTAYVFFLEFYGFQCFVHFYCVFFFFLYSMWANVPISFFYMYLSSFPKTNY